jgi:hypothetical protein
MQIVPTCDKGAVGKIPIRVKPAAFLVQGWTGSLMDSAVDSAAAQAFASSVDDHINTQGGYVTPPYADAWSIAALVRVSSCVNSPHLIPALPQAAEAAVLRPVVGWEHPMQPVGFLKAT